MNQGDIAWLCSVLQSEEIESQGLTHSKGLRNSECHKIKVYSKTRLSALLLYSQKMTQEQRTWSCRLRGSIQSESLIIWV
jgi:hypothetical protein